MHPTNSIVDVSSPSKLSSLRNKRTITLNLIFGGQDSSRSCAPGFLGLHIIDQSCLTLKPVNGVLKNVALFKIKVHKALLIGPSTCISKATQLIPDYFAGNL